MPELPEVEVHRRPLAHWLTGRTVVSAGLRPAGMLPGTTAQSLRKHLALARFLAPVRRGKHLAIPVQDGGARYLHLGMTGHFSRRGTVDPVPRFHALTLILDDGHAVDFTDARRFSRMGWLPTADADHTPPFNALGPDLLDAPPSPAALMQLLRASRRPVKLVLMDQAVVAGLGNIHVVEALWRARIHPLRRADSLTLAEVRRLLTGIRQTFQLVLDDDDGETLPYVTQGAPNPFKVYDRYLETCPRCRKGGIARETHGGRSTYWCPVCQALE